MKRLLIVVLTMALAVGMFAGTAMAEKTLRVGIAKEPVSLNPILIPGVYGETLAGNIFDTLVSFKEDAKQAAPLLAESWTISDDGRVYTFKLRKGVKFHNGQELTAEDVKFTIEATLDEKNASPSREFFKPVTKIETPDNYTVVITLDAPYAPFLLALANPTSGILPASVVKKTGLEGFDKHPIGTGPFEFVEWVPDDRIVLKKNKDYFLTEPKLDKVVFRPIPKPEVMAAELLSGGLDLGGDLLPQDLPRLADAGMQVMSVPGLSFRYVGFADKIAPFNDVRFRKAVYHATPFAQAIPGIFRDSGQRAYSWIPVGVLGDDVQYMQSRALTFDMPKAKALMAELKKEGVVKDGFSFDIYAPQDPQRTKVATVIATQLKQLGLNASVKSLEWSTLAPLLKAGKGGMYVMGWGSVPDPDRWTYKIFMPDSTMNFSKYDNAMVTKALEKGRTLSAPEARQAEYVKAMRKALGEDYVHIPLVFMKTTNVVSKRVIGFKPSPQKYVYLVTDKRNVDIQ